jgi:hypothetical protein
MLAGARPRRGIAPFDRCVFIDLGRATPRLNCRSLTTRSARWLSHLAKQQAPEAEAQGLKQGDGGGEHFDCGCHTFGGKYAAIDLI